MGPGQHRDEQQRGEQQGPDRDETVDELDDLDVDVVEDLDPQQDAEGVRGGWDTLYCQPT